MKHLITALENELQALRHNQINLADRINQAETELTKIKAEMAKAPPELSSSAASKAYKSSADKELAPEPLSSTPAINAHATGVKPSEIGSSNLPTYDETEHVTPQQVATMTAKGAEVKVAPQPSHTGSANTSEQARQAEQDQAEQDAILARLVARKEQAERSAAVKSADAESKSVIPASVRKESLTEPNDSAIKPAIKPVRQAPVHQEPVAQPHTLSEQAASQEQVARLVPKPTRLAASDSAAEAITEPVESLPRSMHKNAIEQASHEWLGSLLGPIAKVSRQLKSFYQHYQQRGLGPVFLMTLAGIAALTLGFGYLLQYSWNNVFSDGMRIAVAVLFANSILAAGLWVYKKKPDMSEYGSGLVGLAIILNYLCGYFAGPYLGLIGSFSALIWLAIVTLTGYGLAQKLETKVVAVIALLGGAFSPLVFGVEQHYPALYLPYILLQALFAWRVCQQLRWHGLLTLASMTHIASAEAFILLVDFHAQLDNWQSLFALLCLNLLFLLYALTGIAKLRKLKVDQHLLGLPMAQLAFFILAMLQVDSWSGQLLAFNSVLFLGLFGYWRKLDEVKHICLVFAGVLAGFAALILVSNEFQGIIWSLEGALLLWLGLRHRYGMVRSEAYVLLLIGLFSTAYSCIRLLLGSNEAIAPLFVISSFAVSAAWLNFAFTLVIVSGCERLLRFYNTSANALDISTAERSVTWGMAELLSLLVALFVYFSCYIWQPSYLMVASALVIPLLLWRTTRQVLPVTETLSWLAYLPLLIQVLLSVQQVGSWRFIEQDLLGQLARISLFTLMWLTYRVYCRYLPSSSLLPIARGVNLIVYLAIPAYLTIKVGKVAFEWVALAAWASAALALTLDYWRKAKALRIEAVLLLALAVLLSLAQGIAFDLWQGWAGLLIGALACVAIVQNIGRCRARLRLLAPLKPLNIVAPYYFTLVLAAAFYYVCQWPEYIAISSWIAVFITLALHAWLRELLLRRVALGFIAIGLLSASLSLWAHQWQGAVGLVMASLLFTALRYYQRPLRLWLKRYPPFHRARLASVYYFALLVVILMVWGVTLPQWSALIFWAGAALALLLHWPMRHVLFRYLIIGLVWLANIAMVMSLFDGNANGWWALGLSALVFSALRARLTHWRGWLFAHQPLTLLRKSVPYYFALLVAISVYVATKVPDVLWLSLWGCALFAFLLHLPIRHLLLRSLGMLLALIASAFNFSLVFMGHFNGVLGLAIGLAALMVYSYCYPSRQCYLRRFKPLAIVYPLKPYYIALAGAALTYYFSHWMALAVLVATSCLVLDLSRWPLHATIRGSWRLALAVIVAAMALLIGLQAFALFGVRDNLLSYAAFDVLGLLGLGWLLFYTPFKRLVRPRYLSWLLLWHGLFIASYLLTGYGFGTEVFAPFSSVALVVHGCWLMMLSLHPQSQRLIKLASALFAFVFIKVIFWDMAGFALVQKVVAFMAIGGVLLLVSYFYLKQKNKQLADKSSAESLSEVES
ncbi:DUF2339 domain-containing protein [Motilimonas sp. E26]|uniref:DUF2339 domain-containing protein n=1 Tax=Motilimonas sp. E26 TaxID=2865674 RepID=UPI001E5E4215|nr:DUF2339 domain-containing protein [Motilimonas sp. E26]MCE0557154.1 DUF2339 domain-containing protein [Motilimonas sp. E26]